MKAFRKIGVALVGVPLLIIGALLLVLPGPGLLVILAGLLILSLEFEIAKKYVDKVRARLQQANDVVRKRTFKKNSVEEPGGLDDDKRQRPPAG